MSANFVKVQSIRSLPELGSQGIRALIDRAMGRFQKIFGSHDTDLFRGALDSRFERAANLFCG